MGYLKWKMVRGMTADSPFEQGSFRCQSIWDSRRPFFKDKVYEVHELIDLFARSVHFTTLASSYLLAWTSPSAF